MRWRGRIRIGKVLKPLVDYKVTKIYPNIARNRQLAVSFFIDAGALSLCYEEVCPSANFGTATRHGQHLLYIGMANGGWIYDQRAQLAL